MWPEDSSKKMVAKGCWVSGTCCCLIADLISLMRVEVSESCLRASWRRFTSSWSEGIEAADVGARLGILENKYIVPLYVWF